MSELLELLLIKMTEPERLKILQKKLVYRPYIDSCT